MGAFSPAYDRAMIRQEASKVPYVFINLAIYDIGNILNANERLNRNQPYSIERRYQPNPILCFNILFVQFRDAKEDESAAPKGVPFGNPFADDKAVAGMKNAQKSTSRPGSPPVDGSSPKRPRTGTYYKK